MCGYGILTLPDESKYEGNFEHNVPSGKGKLMYADGDIYEG